MTDPDPTLRLAHCQDCGAWSFPAEAWGCRVCGAPPDRLEARTPPQTPVLRQAVTLHAELIPGLTVPCRIGEVELAPGVVEEALIAATDDADLSAGLPLRAVPHTAADGRTGWRFVPAEGTPA